MRRAFTLIEVLVAVVIATIVGAALLRMSSNYLGIFGKMEKKERSSEILSLIAVHADKRFDKSTKSLYDILDNSYDIKNDDLRKRLKDTKVEYKEHLVDTITLGEDALGMSEESFADTGFSDEELADEGQSGYAPLIQFELIEVVIKNRELKNAILTIRPLRL